jgi:hypothetical protein
MLNFEEMKNRNLIHFIVLLSVAALAFFQVVFFVHPPKYDMVDCFYPWRFHVGECFQNGVFPFWNPYQDLGYPAHADPSSGVWYPAVWIIGSTLGYNLYTIALEFFIHVLAAGWGTKLLAEKLGFSSKATLIAALSFMLSGIFVGNAQHLPYVIGAAWLPYVITYYFKIIDDGNWKDAVFGAFFLFLMITGGYPAFVIILFYFFLFLFGYILQKKMREKEWMYVKTFLRNNIIFGSVALVLSGGMILTIVQVSPYLSRLNDFTLEKALFSPFGFKAFLSFTNPFATVRFPEFFNGDISMINGYFGIILLSFLPLGFFERRTPKLNWLMVLAIVSLTSAVGADLPVREWLFKYVPLMDLFRFPSVFRLFTILGFVLWGAHAIDSWEKAGSIIKHRVFLFAISILIGAQLYFIIKGFTADVELGKFIAQLFTASSDSVMTQHLWLQGLIQFFLLASVITIYLLKKDTKVKIAMVSVLIALDLIIAAQLNGPYTGYYSELSYKEAFQRTAELPKGFPKLKEITIEEAGKLPSPGQPYWQNLQDFLKQPSAEGFNSFCFGNYEKLESQTPYLFSTIQKNKLYMLTSEFFPEDDMTLKNQDSSFMPGEVFLNSKDIYFIKEKLKHDSLDWIRLDNYTANEFSFECESKSSQLLVLHQQYYDGWKVNVNDKEETLLIADANFMAVQIPKGKSKVVFTYKNTPVLIGFFVSLLLTIAIGILALYNRFVDQRRS